MSDIGKTVADVAIANATDEYEKTGLDSISNYAENLLDAANYYRDFQSATQELLRLKELECEQLEKDKAELVEALRLSTGSINRLFGVEESCEPNEYTNAQNQAYISARNSENLLERLG